MNTTHIVCYSGGHSSALTAIEVVRRYGAHKVTLLNHDIIESSEGVDIKRFKKEVAAYLNLPITYANMSNWDQKDQFDVVVDAGAFKVGTGTALCSNRMKTRPFEAWLAAECSDKRAIIYYGFDATETKRIQRRSSHLGLLGYRTDYPLAFWRERTIQSTVDIGITPPNTYVNFKHANCVGCLKAGKQHWYVVYCLRPDIWEKAKNTEDVIGYTIIKDSSLEELEPLFKLMQSLGIEPTEHIPSGAFWKAVRLKIKSIEIPIETELPCECII